MNDQKLIYDETPYSKKHEARIIGKSTAFGIKLDEPIFYPRGGGQPGDLGHLVVNGHHFKVIDTVKDPEGLVYVKIEDANAINDFEHGTLVTQILAWGLQETLGGWCNACHGYST